MKEVKILYMKRQYKQCSTRCIQILNSIKDPVGTPKTSHIHTKLTNNQYRVHPLYQIYLSFFAASSLELTSRSLHLNSSTKLPLLQQSLTYYQNAESHMEYASFSADPTIVQAVRETRHNSICCTSSSIRSSVDSVFSSTSSLRSSIYTGSSAAPSPTSSCDSGSEKEVMPTHKRALSTPPSNPGAGLAPAPLKVKKKASFSLHLPRILSDDALQLASPSALISAFPSSPTTISAPPSPTGVSTISEFLLSRALIRYTGHLSDLYNQIKYHIKSVESQIATLRKTRKAWRSNLPNLFTDLGSGIDGVDADEMKKIELRSRIERLKAGGWKRTRFDGSQYQVLCEKATVELE
jgi:hypothetical protein